MGACAYVAGMKRALLAGMAVVLGMCVSAFAEAPVITAADPPSGMVGVEYFYDFDIAPIPQEFSVSNMPNGLMEDPTDYTLSGTPTESGTFDVVIRAKSFGGEESQVTRRIVIAPAPPPDDSTPPTAAIASKSVRHLGGNNYEFMFYFTAADNLGVANLEFRGAVSHGAFDAWTAYPYLPTDPFVVGLSCTAFDLEVRAVDTAGNRSAAARYSFDAPVEKPVIKATGVIKGKVGKKFNHRVVALGATRFAATKLPQGCRIDAKSGVIKGTPGKAGTFSVIVTASNAGGSATKTLRIKITN
jgi:hypothetical protein